VFKVNSNATVAARAYEPGYDNSIAASALFLVQPVLFTSVGFSNGMFQMQLLGSAGSNYVLQASTNLYNWTPLVTNAAATNLLYFLDPHSSNYPSRFYRVLQQ